MNIKKFKISCFLLCIFLFNIQISQAQTVSTFAGTAPLSGSTDALGALARFNLPQGMVFDAAGNLFVCDYNNHTIRKITPAGLVSTFASSAGIVGNANGVGAAARFNFPADITIDGTGNLYVVDSGVGNNIVRKITPAAVVTTFAGTPSFFGGSADGIGAAASFSVPFGITIDASGNNLFVADLFNHTIRKITIAGVVVTTFAGTAGFSGSTDGAGAAARFNQPIGIDTDAAGNVFVADFGNHTVRKITPAGLVSTFAGSAGAIGTTNATGTLARFSRPIFLTIDGSDNVYVTDRDNHTIRKITPAAVVTTFAGTAGATGSTDGMGAVVRFNGPNGIAIDGSGDLYVSEIGNNTIRKIIGAAPALCLVITPPIGTDNYWMGCTNSDWNLATNWSLGTIPTASEVVYVPKNTLNPLIIKVTATCGKFIQAFGAVVKIDYNVGGKLVVKF